MRVFIGIELPYEVKEYLESIQRIIKPTTIKGDFTHFNNFHITLKYIGHVDEEEIDILEDILDQIAEDTKQFSIKINGLGSFEKKHTSIIWLGLQEGKEDLRKIFHKIENLCHEQGFDKENRKYRPHMTIGKKIQFSNHHSTNYIPPYINPVRVSSITLFLSHRIDDVLTYTPIYKVNLS